MRDVLVGAAESSSVVTVVVGFGRTHRVRLVAVGADMVVATPSGAPGETERTLLLGLGAIRTIVVHRTDATVGAAGWVGSAGRAEMKPSSEAPAHGLLMGDILSQHLAARPRITAWVGTEQMSGTLTSVGLDVVGISTEGSGETAYVRLDSTTEIAVSVSSSL